MNYPYYKMRVSKCFCVTPNPIGMLWSKLKAFLRKLKPRNRVDFDTAVSNFIASLQQKDLVGYFFENEACTLLI